MAIDETEAKMIAAGARVRRKPRQPPRLPPLGYDNTLSYMLKVEGPDAIMELAEEASEAVRDWLEKYFDRKLLDQLRFESLMLPYFFEARRIGDKRGQKRVESMLAGLFPGTE